MTIFPPTLPAELSDPQSVGPVTRSVNVPMVRVAQPDAGLRAARFVAYSSGVPKREADGLFGRKTRRSFDGLPL